MTDIILDDTEYKAFVQRSEKPLAELRKKMLGEIEEIKMRSDRYTKGVAIGISPNDNMLNHYKRGQITDIITGIFKKLRAKGSDGRIVPIAPVALLLVGEYSPKHRWHYHGLIVVDNIVILEKIKRKINNIIGRTVTEQINNVVAYINYMFKQYECPSHGLYYVWNKKECVIEYNKDK